MRRPALSKIALLAIPMAFAAGCSSKPAPVAASSAPAPAATPAPTPVAETRPTPRPTPEPTETLPAVGDINKKGYLKDAFFDFDRYDIRADQRGPVTANAEWLRKWPTVKIRVEGHCDERGTAAYNMALGEKRASAVKEYLESMGIDASRVEIISYGKERPFDTGHDEAAWAQNRRGHLVATAK